MYSAAVSLSRFSGFAVRRASSCSTSQTNLALQMTAWGPCSDIVTIPPPASLVWARNAATLSTPSIPSMHSDLSDMARTGRTSRPPLHVCSSKSRAQPPGLALNMWCVPVSHTCSGGTYRLTVLAACMPTAEKTYEAPNEGVPAALEAGNLVRTIVCSGDDSVG